MAEINFSRGTFQTYNNIEQYDDNTLYFIEDIGKVFKGTTDVTKSVIFVTDQQYQQVINGAPQRVAPGMLYINSTNFKVACKNGNQVVEILPGSVMLNMTAQEYEDATEEEVAGKLIIVDETETVEPNNG